MSNLRCRIVQYDMTCRILCHVKPNQNVPNQPLKFGIFYVCKNCCHEFVIFDFTSATLEFTVAKKLMFSFSQTSLKVT
jgi:hypothetical protein